MTKKIGYRSGQVSVKINFFGDKDISPNFCYYIRCISIQKIKNSQLLLLRRFCFTKQILNLCQCSIVSDNITAPSLLFRIL